MSSQLPLGGQNSSTKRWLVIGLYLIMFLPLLFVPLTFFPWHYGKTVIFQIIVELLMVTLIFGSRHACPPQGRAVPLRYRLNYLDWAIVVFIAIIGGFFIVGSPTTQRDRRFDEVRVSNLQQIQSELINYWANKNKLPANLDSLNNSISGFAVPKDPQDNRAYEYIVTNSLAFQLCANFKTEGDSSNIGSGMVQPMIYPYNQNWNHRIGRTCFERTIDPQLYKNPKLLTP